jgi:hypothetical protein
MKGETSKKSPEEPAKNVRRQLPRNRFDLFMSQFGITAVRNPRNSELP